MSHGTASTLILNPAGKTAITFNLTAATAAITTYSYIVDLGRVDLGEEDRWQWAYEQNRLGGRVVGSEGELVPVRVYVIIKAATSDYRKEAYRVLQEAVMNRRGGTLQYRPENAGAGVLDTYYHYVASAPPRIVDEPSNRWDAASVGGLYTLQVELELQTQPLATSDTANPATVIAAQVIDNWENGSTLSNRITVAKTALQGSFPALVRLIMEPWSNQDLGRVVLFRRGSEDGTLANLVSLYEAYYAAEIAPSIAWTVAATTIYPRDGQTCSPTAEGNGAAYGLRFTLSNPVDHNGRFAVFGLGYDDAAAKETWTHQVKLVAGNVSQAGAASYFATQLHTWGLIYAGEFELPITDLSDVTAGYDAGPYLEWYSVRHSGASEFTLQALVLVWVSDALGAEGAGTALDVVCDDEGGVDSPERVLVENFTKYGRILERGYTLVQDGDIKRVLKTAPRGDFVELDPAQDHVLVFVQERASGYTVIDDDFSGYAATGYLPILEMESAEGWTLTGAAHSTTNLVEGAASIILDTTGTATAQSPTLTQDLNADGRFNDPDYIVLAVYIENVSSFTAVQIQFRTGPSDYFYHNILKAAVNTGWNSIAVKKGDFSVQGSPTWATVANVYFTNGIITAQGDVGVDFLRVEKADPDNAALPNPTGATWNFNGKKWGITADVTVDEADKTLATLDSGATLRLALLDADIPLDAEITARVMTKKYAGKAGIAFRMHPDSLIAGNEEGYLACIHTTAASTVSVYAYTSGAIVATYSSAFTAVPDRMYTMGVRIKSKALVGLFDQYDVYAALSSALDYDDSRIFEEANHAITGYDVVGNAEGAGLGSIGTLGRFATFTVKSITDKLYYEDQLRVEGKAVFRTISPFD